MEREIRILVVEDEESILDGIRINLELCDYEVVTAVTGLEAIKKFNEQRFNLVVLDIMLPEVNGLEVCEKIRLTDTETPILFLTAKDTTEDRITGLKKGADDYLPKPFNLEEFLLRVKNLVRRSLSEDEKLALESYSFGGNEVNFKTFEATCQQGKITLTPKEAKLLKYLISHKNEVVSRDKILQSVWGYDVMPNTRTIDNFILNFRKYFERDTNKHQFFVSVRSVGYKFMEESEPLG